MENTHKIYAINSRRIEPQRVVIYDRRTSAVAVPPNSLTHSLYNFDAVYSIREFFSASPRNLPLFIYSYFFPFFCLYLRKYPTVWGCRIRWASAPSQLPKSIGCVLLCFRWIRWQCDGGALFWAQDSFCYFAFMRVYFIIRELPKITVRQDGTSDASVVVVVVPLAFFFQSAHCSQTVARKWCDNGGVASDNKWDSFWASALDALWSLTMWRTALIQVVWSWVKLQ